MKVSRYEGFEHQNKRIDKICLQNLQTSITRDTFITYVTHCTFSERPSSSLLTSIGANAALPKHEDGSKASEEMATTSSPGWRAALPHVYFVHEFGIALQHGWPFWSSRLALLPNLRKQTANKAHLL